MKWSLILSCLVVLLSACQSQPAYTDNGNPGQIKAVIFYDDNRNGVMDSNETGFQTELGLSQDISCPPSRMEAIVSIAADVNGEALFTDLTPGKYCLHPIRNFGMTTEQNLDVYVSSDETATVFFGIVRE